MRVSSMLSLLAVFLLICYPVHQLIFSISEDGRSILYRPEIDIERDSGVHTGTRATRYVDDSGGQAYQTIQSAVNAANPGDTVYVYPGTYPENVMVGKSLTLTGQDSSTTVIRGTGAGDVVNITANDVRMSGFTVCGTGTGHSDAAIKLHEVTGCSIENNVCELRNFQSTSVLFNDNFDDGSLSPWTRNGNYAWVSTHTYNSYRYSMYLNGGTVSTTSPSINLQGASSASLECWIRRGGSFSEDPDSGEDLYVEYYDSGYVYKTIKTFAGNGIEGQIYRENLNLPAGALWSSFRVRFYLTTGSGDEFDYWHIDDVKVTKYVDIRADVNWGIYLRGGSGNIISHNDCSTTALGGIVLNASRDNDVNNNTCEDMGKGIWLTNSHGNRLRDNDLDKDDSGFYISSSDGNRLENNVVNDCIVGIQMIDSIHNDIDGNALDGNDHGIYAVNPQGSNITNNSIKDCSAKGIEVRGGMENLLWGNNCTGSPTGIHLEGCDGNVVGRSILTDNDHGIDMTSSHRNEVHNNTMAGAFATGIRLDQCDRNNVTQNNCSSSTTGIEAKTGSGNDFRQNNLTGNTYGIYLLNVRTGRIMENHFEGNVYGIRTVDSGGLDFGNDTFTSNTYGLVLENTDNCTLSGNHLEGPGVEGISVSGKGDNRIINNTCLGEMGTGIRVIDSFGCELRENLCSSPVESSTGLLVRDSRGCAIARNTFIGNLVGISLRGTNDSVLSTNNCSGNGWTGININSSFGNDLLENICSDNTPPGGGLDTGYGIYVFLGSEGNSLMNNTCSRNRDHGVYIAGRSHLNSIRNNTCIENGEHGIFVADSRDNEIIDSLCGSNTVAGITATNANSTIIEGNELLENGRWGINLSESEECVVRYNTINGSERAGINLRSVDLSVVSGNTVTASTMWGLRLERSSENRAEHNILSGSGQHGILLLTGSDSNLLRENLVSGSGLEGIVIRSPEERRGGRNEKNVRDDLNVSENNRIHHNNLVENNNGGVQARDDGRGTLWDDGNLEGNFWYDYRTRYPSADHNGRIWDTPYEVPGIAGVNDSYPLLYARDGLDPTAPLILRDNTAKRATTGDLFSFSAEFTDDFGIVVANVVYSYDGIDFKNETMTRIDDTNRQYTFTVIPNATVIHYMYFLKDIGRNKNTSALINVSVLDNDPPELGRDLSEKRGGTGDPFTIRMNAVDNIAVKNESVYVHYTFDEVEYFLENMSLEEGNFTRTIDVPPHATYVQYSFNISDTSGNWLNTTRTEATIDDNDPPGFSSDAVAGDNLTTGDEVRLKANFTDNIGVFSAFVRYTFDGGEPFNDSMKHISGEEWELVISVPGTAVLINYSYYVSDEEENFLATPSIVRSILDNDPPRANAGADAKAAIGERIRINGSGSSDNLGIVNYTWTIHFGNKNETRYGMEVNPAFDGVGAYVVMLRVTDAAGNAAEDILNVTVTGSGGGDDDDDDDTGGDDDDVAPHDDDSGGDDDTGGGGESVGGKSEGGPWFILLIIAVTVVLIILGIAIFLLRRKKKKKEGADAEQEEATVHDTIEVSIVDPEDEKKYPCASCGSEMKFVDEYGKWWCDACSKYADEEKVRVVAELLAPPAPYPAPYPPFPAGPDAATAAGTQALPPPPANLYLPGSPPVGMAPVSGQATPGTGAGGAYHPDGSINAMLPRMPDEIITIKALPPAPDIDLAALGIPVATGKPLNAPMPPPLEAAGYPPSPSSSPPPSVSGMAEDPMNALKQRLATGEISIDEFQRLKAIIEQ